MSHVDPDYATWRDDATEWDEQYPADSDHPGPVQARRLLHLLDLRDAAENAQDAAGIDASPSVAPESTPTTNGAESGVSGVLAAEEQAVLRRLVHTCTYDCTLDQCAIDESDCDVADAVTEWHAAIVREHTERAWDEAILHVESHLGGPIKRAAIKDNPYRAARQEQ